MRIKDDAASSGRRLTDAQRRQLRRLIAREDVDGLVEFIHAVKCPYNYEPGADAYLTLRLVQLHDPDASFADALPQLRELAVCKDWGVDPAASRLVRVNPLEDFDEDDDDEQNGNGYHA